MDPVTAFLAILGGFIAGSGGFWVYLTNKYEKKDATSSLIMGLAHDKIIYLCVKYIEKEFVTKDEYEDLIKYFWEPYQALGGDGTVERLMGMVHKLPLKPELRQFREVREVADRHPEGAKKVIKELKEGDDGYERSK